MTALNNWILVGVKENKGTRTMHLFKISKWRQWCQRTSSWMVSLLLTLNISGTLTYFLSLSYVYIQHIKPLFLKLALTMYSPVGFASSRYWNSIFVKLIEKERICFQMKILQQPKSFSPEIWLVLSWRVKNHQIPVNEVLSEISRNRVKYKLSVQDAEPKTLKMRQESFSIPVFSSVHRSPSFNSHPL